MKRTFKTNSGRTYLTTGNSLALPVYSSLFLYAQLERLRHYLLGSPEEVLEFPLKSKHTFSGLYRGAAAAGFGSAGREWKTSFRGRILDRVTSVEEFKKKKVSFINVRPYTVEIERGWFKVWNKWGTPLAVLEKTLFDRPAKLLV